MVKDSNSKQANFCFVQPILNLLRLVVPKEAFTQCRQPQSQKYRQIQPQSGKWKWLADTGRWVFALSANLPLIWIKQSIHICLSFVTYLWSSLMYIKNMFFGNDAVQGAYFNSGAKSCLQFLYRNLWSL